MNKIVLAGLLLAIVGIAGLTVVGGEGFASPGTGLAPTFQGGPWGWMMGWGHMGRMGGHMGGSWQPAPSGTAPAAVAAAPTVEVAGLDFGLRPGQLRVRAGQTVNLALTNRGAILHDVTIPALGFQLVAQPGQRAVGALTPTTPGTYEFYCSVPGHREAGMIGRLVVTP